MPEATTLTAALDVLKEFGVFEVYLPFLLTFALFYGLIRKMNLFGRDEKDTGANKIAVVVAGVAATYVMIFSPVAIPISEFFATFFAQASVALVTLLVFLMIVGMLFSSSFIEENKFEFGAMLKWVMAAGFLIAIAMFVSSGGVALFSQMVPPGFSLSGEDVALIALVLLTIGAIIFLVSEGKGTASRIVIPTKTP